MIQSNFEKIDDFQKAAGATRPSSPTVPNLEILAFRLRLIAEEYDEVQEAIMNLATQVELNKSGDLTDLAHE